MVGRVTNVDGYNANCHAIMLIKIVDNAFFPPSSQRLNSHKKIHFKKIELSQYLAAGKCINIIFLIRMDILKFYNI